MKILILKLNATGDVVRTTPLLRRLEGEISWVTARNNIALLNGLTENLRSLSWEDRDSIRAEEYDLVINLEDEVQLAAFVKSIRYKQLFGAYMNGSDVLSYTEDSRRWFDLSLISVYGKQKADALKFQNRQTYQQLIFQGLGFRFTGETYVLPEPHYTDLSGDVAVAPVAGAVWPMKNWAFYGELKKKLEAEGLTVNLLPKRSTLLEHLNDVRNHRCLVGGDSLPMHFALGTNTRCVSLFTCTSPWEIHDYGLQEKIVSPWLGDFFYQRGFDLRATTAISLEEVFNATIRQLHERAGCSQAMRKEAISTGPIEIRKPPGTAVVYCDGEDRAAAPLSPSVCARQVAILTGGGDRPYVIGLGSALIAEGVPIDIIGSDQVDHPDLHRSSSARFLNLRGDTNPDVSTARKVSRVLVYYWRLIRYSITAKPKLFHILWNNKFELLDRTLLMLWYRFLGKRIAFTVHNVNAAWRDGNDNILNRLTLRIQYRLADHLFVHAERLKRVLQSEYRVPGSKVSVIPFGINNTVPKTALTCSEARKCLGLTAQQRVLLFFGQISPYKGLEYLVDAFIPLAQVEPDYRLIIAGRPKNCAPYWEAIRRQISSAGIRSKIVERIGWLPDADTEIYFKAADVVILPYTYIFQSGVLYLAYNFGLPVIASDVGCFREDIADGKTGFVCKPQDAVDLARCIDTYFASELYRELETRRQDIKDFAAKKYSWTTVSEITQSVYKKLLPQR